MRNLNAKKLDKKIKIIEDYNSSAKIYDNRYKIIQNYKFKLIIENLVFKSGIYLDAGSGTNLFLDYLNKEKITRNIRLIGLDISFNMLKIAKEKQKKSCLILGDIENLPFKRNLFAGFISITSFQNLPDIRKGIEEMNRVFKRSGLLAITILKKSFNLNEIKKLFQPHFQDLNYIYDNKCEDWIIFKNIKDD